MWTSKPIHITNIILTSFATTAKDYGGTIYCWILSLLPFWVEGLRFCFWSCWYSNNDLSQIRSSCGIDRTIIKEYLAGLNELVTVYSAQVNGLVSLCWLCNAVIRQIQPVINRYRRRRRETAGLSDDGGRASETVTTVDGEPSSDDEPGSGVGGLTSDLANGNGPPGPVRDLIHDQAILDTVDGSAGGEIVGFPGGPNEGLDEVGFLGIGSDDPALLDPSLPVKGPKRAEILARALKREIARLKM